MDPAFKYEQLVRAAHALETGKPAQRTEHEYADADLFTNSNKAKASEGMTYAFETIGETAIREGDLDEDEAERIRGFAQSVDPTDSLPEMSAQVSDFMESVYSRYFTVKSNSVPEFSAP